MPIDWQPGTADSFRAQQQAGVILASVSPRRRLLLPIVCPVKACISPDVDETPLPGESSAALAVRLAETKLARAMSMLGRPAESAIVVAADTVVALDEQPLGKPSDAAEARSMLMALRGRSHTVITAVALGEPVSGMVDGAAWVATEVAMRELETSAIERYIARGEPFDKAGGYAIQDDELRPVTAIVGCFTNVVGLPLCAIEAKLTGESRGGQFLPPEVPCSLCRKASTALKTQGLWAPQC